MNFNLYHTKLINNDYKIENNEVVSHNIEQFSGFSSIFNSNFELI